MAVPIGIVGAARSGGGGGGWVPTDLGGILFAWWDASDTSSITDAGGGAVSQINDKSGNTRHMTQGTALNRPTTGTRTINGLNGLDLNPSVNPQHLTSGNITQAQPHTYVAIVQFDNADGLTRNIYSSTDSVFLRTASGAWSMNAGVALNGGTDDATAHLFVAIFNGASSSLRIDGVSVASGDAGSNSIAASPILIGRNTTSTSWDGIFGEGFLIDGVLSGANLTNVENYAPTKWGTP